MKPGIHFIKLLTCLMLKATQKLWELALTMDVRYNLLHQPKFGNLQLVMNNNIWLTALSLNTSIL